MRLTDQHIDYISTNLELYGLKNKDLIPNVFVKSGSYANGLLKLIQVVFS
mgnify:CR=1 FL=1